MLGEAGKASHQELPHYDDVEPVSEEAVGNGWVGK